jgi:hypothetical protein
MDTPNDTTPEVTPEEPQAVIGTKDGDTAADNDQPYRFGRRPNVRAPYPFTERQFARLLILRGRIQSTAWQEDRAA